MPFWRDRSSYKQNQWREHKANKNGLRKTVYEVNGDKYEGEWKDNLKHGKGKQILHNGTMYEGDWEHNTRNGFGILSLLVNGQYIRKYIGQWKNDKFHGQGTLMYSNNEYYEGEFKNSKRNGWGKMHWVNGDVYEGEWLNDMRHGKGMQEYANGNWVQCKWHEDHKHGYGKYYFPSSGQVLKGYWHNDVCKIGSMEDLSRENAPQPTPFPISRCQLLDSDGVLKTEMTKLFS